MDRPVLVYDGGCGVCTRLATVVTTRLRSTPQDYDVTAYQDADLEAWGLTAQQCDAALQWVSTDGRVSSGEDAVAQALRASRMPARPLGALVQVPGVRTVAGLAYRWVANHRHLLPGGTPACSMPVAQRPS